MKQDLLNLYSINMKYNRDLHKADDRVMSVSPQIGKDTRKFVGIIVIVESKKYCIPLTSFKEKFEIKSREDFIKIPHPTRKSENGAPKTIAILNLNNMIPVSESLIQKIDLSKKTPDQNLLINELRWCRDNSSLIVRKANKLYNKITLTPQKDPNLTKRCCDFKKLEGVLEKWISKDKVNFNEKMDFCTKVFVANPQLKAQYDIAEKEYLKRHNLSIGKGSSPEFRYKLCSNVLNSNLSLKQEFQKAMDALIKPDLNIRPTKPKHKH